MGEKVSKENPNDITSNRFKSKTKLPQFWYMRKLGSNGMVQLYFDFACTSLQDLDIKINMCERSCPNFEYGKVASNEMI